MAANTDLTTGSALLPKHANVAAVGTTWQRFNLPRTPGARRVTIKADAAIYYATESGGDDDGGAVSAPYITLSLAEAAAGWYEALPASDGQRVSYILVAAQAGTAAVSVSLEG